MIGGPGLAGVIAQLAGTATGMLADAASFAVSFLCLALNRADRRPAEPAAVSPRTLLAEVAGSG